MIVNIIILLLGFVLLIAGADKLIDASSSLARRFNIPDIVIGLTIVALGTSAPELVVNIVASSKNESAMVLGNVLGSNIFNVLLILGVTSMAGRLIVKRNTTWLEIPLSFLAALIVLVVSSDMFLDNQPANVVSRTEGIILIGLFLIFLVYNVELAKNGKEENELKSKDQRIFISILWLLVGLAALIYGGHLIVEKATLLAKDFGISERVIAITIISVGTSLPELATSLVAVRKGKVDLAIGNVVGSSLFNIFLILGVSAIINPVKVADNSFLDIYLNILANLLLFVFLFFNIKRQLYRVEGFIFLLLYLCYIIFLLFPDKFPVWN